MYLDCFSNELRHKIFCNAICRYVKFVDIMQVKSESKKPKQYPLYQNTLM